ncbi:MAG TPA: DoxX family protein [Burkholderiales bacterium]
MLENWLRIAGEQLIIGYFLVTGISNLTKARIADHIERMAGFGVPFPRATFWLGIGLQFGSCALVVFDWHGRLGALGLIVFTIAATGIFHRFWLKSDPHQRNLSRINLLSNIAVLGGLLLLLVHLH